MSKISTAEDTSCREIELSMDKRHRACLPALKLAVAVKTAYSITLQRLLLETTAAVGGFINRVCFSFLGGVDARRLGNDEKKRSVVGLVSSRLSIACQICPKKGRC